jgi:hypothetical protein
MTLKSKKRVSGGGGIPDSKPEECRYTLVGDVLVSEAFIGRVSQYWGPFYYSYGGVLVEGDLFFGDFVEKLKPNERKVLMHVVLLLLARGEFPLHVESDAEAIDESKSTTPATNN